jgi:hypothetical protein
VSEKPVEIIDQACITISELSDKRILIRSLEGLPSGPVAEMADNLLAMWVAIAKSCGDEVFCENLGHAVDKAHDELVRKAEASDAQLTALTEIAKGEGAFSTDQLTHATNCIENMKAIAKAAIAATAGEKGTGE